MALFNWHGLFYHIITMAKNVFIVGIDEFNQEKLRHFANGKFRFHGLSTHDEVMRLVDFASHESDPRSVVDEFVKSLELALDNFQEPVSGVAGYWDFPVTSIVPLICRDRRLPGPSLESVLKCEHKYWSRVEQSKVLRDVPPFDVINPFEAQDVAGVDVPLPFWLKPVKAAGSDLGFKIENQADFSLALGTIRANIGPYAEPFNYFLEKVDLPGELRGIDGHYCLAEGVIRGWQCTLSGYVHNNKCHIYGVVDSLRYDSTSSFLCYEYPSRLPEEVKDYMKDAASTLMTSIGYNQAAFNMEFFWDSESGEINLLEVNPRVSQSHSDVYEKVDGVAHLKIMADLAVGNKPHFPHFKGRWNCAGKFFMRRFQDGTVRRVPSDAEVNALESRFENTLIEIMPEEGKRLSNLQRQDSYSYELAHIHLGANSHDELHRKFKECSEQLPFEFED